MLMTLNNAASCPYGIISSFPHGIMLRLAYLQAVDCGFFLSSSYVCCCWGHGLADLFLPLFLSASHHGAVPCALSFVTTAYKT